MYIYGYIHTYIHTYIYIYIHIHIHTHHSLETETPAEAVTFRPSTARQTAPRQKYI